MYVYIYVFMYVYMYLYVYICTHKCISKSRETEVMDASSLEVLKPDWLGLGAT